MPFTDNSAVAQRERDLENHEAFFSVFAIRLLNHIMYKLLISSCLPKENITSLRLFKAWDAAWTGTHLDRQALRADCFQLASAA